jgi:hypothetical protein
VQATEVTPDGIGGCAAGDTFGQEAHAGFYKFNIQNCVHSIEQMFFSTILLGGQGITRELRVNTMSLVRGQRLLVMADFVWRH